MKMFASLLERVMPVFGRSSTLTFAKYTIDRFNPSGLTWKDWIQLLWEWVWQHRHRKPRIPLPVLDFRFDEPIPDDRLSFRWLGHSSIYMTLGGLRIFIDPVMSRNPSPFPWLGEGGYSRGLSKQTLESLDETTIDVVLLSHDHYDHLDYPTIMRLKDRVQTFIVPNGVQAHLLHWGVPAARIRVAEQYGVVIEEHGVTFTCEEGRHFSGRHLWDRGQTMWCSWVIEQRKTKQKVFYSGDSGYGEHFQRIGKQYGPFDWAFMECGQYDRRWESVHMLPKQTAAAAHDIGARNVIPVHWGSFVLSVHDWFDPVEKLSAALADDVERGQLKLWTPMPGEQVGADDEPLRNFKWWRLYM